MTQTTQQFRDAQPISAVAWIDRDMLRANDYNPNHVAPPELALLKTSIIENGWTQPIVARAVLTFDGEPDETGAREPEVDYYEIVDGFHRWTVSNDPDVGGLTGGMVPVVQLPATLDAATQQLATVRHNRARGTHHVVKMADIVANLDDLGLSAETIAERCGMDAEEVDRLLDRGNMVKRASVGGFSEGWVPGRDGVDGVAK